MWIWWLRWRKLHFIWTMYSCTQKCISVSISVQSVQDARYQVHVPVRQIQRKSTDNLARLQIPTWLSTSLPAEVHTQRQCSITLSKSNAQSRGISEQCTCVLSEQCTNNFLLHCTINSITMSKSNAQSRGISVLVYSGTVCSQLSFTMVCHHTNVTIPNSYNPTLTQHGWSSGALNLLNN